MDNKQAQADIQKSFDVDKSRYLGLHGTAFSAATPFARATSAAASRFAMTGTRRKKGDFQAGIGRRKGANLAFMERIAREIRRGGRTVLFVELAVPESPTGAVTVVAPHLENKCKPGCRVKQAEQILELDPW